MATVREPAVEDAPDLGVVHVRAWQRAYRGGLMPDEYLDSLSPEDRAQMWAEALQRPPRPRSARFVSQDDAGAVVGFILVGPMTGDLDGETGEVYALNMHPDVWGAGYIAASTRRRDGALRSSSGEQRYCESRCPRCATGARCERAVSP